MYLLFDSFFSASNGKSFSLYFSTTWHSFSQSSAVIYYDDELLAKNFQHYFWEIPIAIFQTFFFALTLTRRDEIRRVQQRKFSTSCFAISHLTRKQIKLKTLVFSFCQWKYLKQGNSFLSRVFLKWVCKIFALLRLKRKTKTEKYCSKKQQKLLMNFSYTASRFLNDVFNRSSEWRLNENLSLRMEAESKKRVFLLVFI